MNDTVATPQVLNEQDPYIFSGSTNIAQRLDAQNELLFANSREHLAQAGLSTGQVVYDLGCSSGTMTVYLAQAIGPTGHIYALDKSLEQINRAREKVVAHNLQNVTFIQTDMNDPAHLPDTKTDLVYMRYVLMHARQPDDIIQNVKSLLRDGSVVVSQESVMRTSSCSIDNVVLQEYIRVLNTLGRRLGVNYNIGDHTAHLFQQVGFSTVKDWTREPVIKLSQAKQLLMLGVTEWRDKAVRFEITTSNDIDRWVSTIQGWPDDGDATYTIAKQTHVIAYN